MEYLLAIVGFVVGAGLTYWLMQQKINQKEKSHSNKLRELREELERNHELRMQETIKSLQKDYQNQLNKETKELEKAHETKLQETINSIEGQSQQTYKLVDREIVTPKQESLGVVEETVQEIPEIPEILVTDSSVTSPLIAVETVALTSNTIEESSSQEPEQLVESEALPEDTLVLTQDVDNRVEIYDLRVDKISNTITKTEQRLDEKILAWKKSRQVTFIPQLIEHINYPDSQVRALLASALGEIAACKSTSVEIQRAIPILGKLSQDPVPSVRKAAIEALSNIKSEKVIPFLQKALRDSESDVVKSASVAINKFKFYRVSSTKKSVKTMAKVRR